MCMVRRYSNHNPDKWCAPIAGLIAGLWLKADPLESRRNLIMILIIAKALDCLLNILFRIAFSLH